MASGNINKGTWAVNGLLHPKGWRTLATTVNVRSTWQLFAEPRGVRRLWGSESTRGRSKPAGVGENWCGTTMDARTVRSIRGEGGDPWVVGVHSERYSREKPLVGGKEAAVPLDHWGVYQRGQNLEDGTQVRKGISGGREGWGYNESSRPRRGASGRT